MGLVIKKKTAMLSSKAFILLAVLSLLAQPLHGPVGGLWSSYSASAAPVQSGTTWNVSSANDLKQALADPTIHHITLTADITTNESFVLSRDNVTINGNDKKITAPNLPGWVSNGENYGLKIYKATGISINSLRVAGGNAAIQLNGSSVRLTGNMHVSDNRFGGIEVSRGSGVVEDSELVVAGSFWDPSNSESAGRPAIWVVNGQGTVSGVDGFIRATHIKPDQTQYYLKNAHSGVIATNVTKNTTHATVQSAIDLASPGDEIRLENDVVLSAAIQANKPVVINGNNKTITSDYTKTSGSNNAAILITSDNVMVKNVTVTRSAAAQRADNWVHGINVYESNGVMLSGVHC